MAGWSYAFFDYRIGYDLFKTEFVGLKHFLAPFNNEVMRREILRVMRNTMAMSLIGYATSFLPMLFAIFLSEIRSTTYRRIVQTITTLPNFVSWALVYALALSMFSVDDGFVNNLLIKTGLAENRINFLASADHVDPDSATQDFDTGKAKSTAGRQIFQHWDWYGDYNAENKNAGRGFMPVPYGEQKSKAHPDKPTGQQWVWGIPKNTKNLEAALKFFNWAHSPEATDLFGAGPRGLIWDIDSSGLRYVTDRGWQLIERNTIDHGYGNAADALGNIGGSGATLPNGQAADYRRWETSIMHENNNPLYRSWSADHNNAADISRYLFDNGKAVKAHPAIMQMPPLPTDLENIMTQIGDVVKTNSWRAIFARNDAEFEALWKDAQTKANGLGMQRLLDWTVQAWNQAKAASAKYQ